VAIAMIFVSRSYQNYKNWVVSNQLIGVGSGGGGGYVFIGYNEYL